MKKVFCFLIPLVFLLCGCTQATQEQEDAVFTRADNGNLIGFSGVEYAPFASEGFLYYLGELEFVGYVQGEEKSSQHFGISYQTGMFAVKNKDNDNILIRYAPDNEWFSIYRKTSLPTFDFSADNCVRLEFVSERGDLEKDAIHTACKSGIADQAEIADFLSAIRAQQNPQDAGLYDLVKKPDGMFENCYVCGVVYGFFAEEPNLAIRMEITSYNDLAYSISMGETEYVLPEQWRQKLLDSKCTP